jgi:hypothetical protein
MAAETKGMEIGASASELRGGGPSSLAHSLAHSLVSGRWFLARSLTGDANASAAPRFEIKKWNAVAMWSWDICADTCAICRNSLNEPSIEYQANPRCDAAAAAAVRGRSDCWDLSISGVLELATSPHFTHDLRPVSVPTTRTGSPSPSAAAATCSTLIAFRGGSKLAVYAPSVIRNGNSRRSREFQVRTGSQPFPFYCTTSTS